jgi:hypothetical protein
MYFYKIICNDPAITNIYIGSSIDLKQREHLHKSNCNNPNDKGYNYLVYTTIRNNGGWDNWRMLEIENKIVKDLDEALTHEQYLIEFYKANMNMVRAKYLGEDYQREYRELHRDKLNANSLEYYTEHREHLNAISSKSYYDNIDERLATQRQYYQEHRDEALKYQREYRNITENRDKKREYNVKYYQENKDEFRLYSNEYRKNHQVELNEYNRNYYHEHKESINAQRREKDNRDKLNDYQREYRLKNSEKLKEYDRERSRLRRIAKKNKAISSNPP